MTNETVTISVDYFAELYAKANKPKTQMVECKGECQYLKTIAKERDELKAKLEDALAHYCTNATGELGNACKVAVLYRENVAKLETAERCIDDIDGILKGVEDGALSVDDIKDIIRAWRENLEAK